jgi:hypothetical protein
VIHRQSTGKVQIAIARFSKRWLKRSSFINFTKRRRRGYLGVELREVQNVKPGFRIGTEEDSGSLTVNLSNKPQGKGMLIRPVSGGIRRRLDQALRL